MTKELKLTESKVLKGYNKPSMVLSASVAVLAVVETMKFLEPYVFEAKVKKEHKKEIKSLEKQLVKNRKNFIKYLKGKGFSNKEANRMADSVDKSLETLIKL